ncbi:hypothetical protein [Nostoc sp. PCC 7107]|uniref:hypothetical protein n=1 Tax=Nostoc sp. PCC 7107 TaxID=317936 RepID=UPI00030D2CAB|nr:hypothetical protein [Nostoc sp. PCC 7107]
MDLRCAIATPERSHNAPLDIWRCVSTDFRQHHFHGRVISISFTDAVLDYAIP